VDDLAGRDLGLDPVEKADELGGTKSGARDSLNWRTRCGCRPCARQMRRTKLTLMPTPLAYIAAVQCVASPGGSARVNATARSHTLVGSGGMSESRVLSRSRPATPARMSAPATATRSLCSRPSGASCHWCLPRPPSAARSAPTKYVFVGYSGLQRSPPSAFTSTVNPSRMPAPLRLSELTLTDS